MTNPASESVTDSRVGQRTVRRISYLIPGFGFAGGLIAALLHRGDWAEGLIAGAALAWLNFLALKRGVEALTSRPATPGNNPPTRLRSASYVVAVFRYILIGAAVYVIFNFLHVPLLSLALGLCAFVAATIAATVWEILQSLG